MQGADLSIMTALKITKPGAKSLFDLGVRCKPHSDTTHYMIKAFDSMMGGAIFDASQASSDDFETSEQHPSSDECNLRSPRDPVGYSKCAPDPKHHSQVMRNTIKAEWITSETSEINGLWRLGIKRFATLVPLTKTLSFCGVGWMRIGPKILTSNDLTRDILMMNGGPISWKSRRQDNVSLSTFEAGFFAASQAGQEAIYPRETLTDFGYSQTKTTLLCSKMRLRQRSDGGLSACTGGMVRAGMSKGKTDLFRDSHAFHEHVS